MAIKKLRIKQLIFQIKESLIFPAKNRQKPYASFEGQYVLRWIGTTHLFAQRWVGKVRSTLHVGMELGIAASIMS